MINLKITGSMIRRLGQQTKSTTECIRIQSKYNKKHSFKLLLPLCKRTKVFTIFSRCSKLIWNDMVPEFFHEGLG